MYHTEHKLLSYLMLMTVSIGIHLGILEIVCGYFRKYIPCDLLGICTLVHVNQNFSDKGSFNSMDQGRYYTSIVTKYLDTATVNAIAKFYNTTLPADMIITK